MTEVTLGSLLFSRQQNRDATHVAVLPVIATTTLSPGQRIGVAASVSRDALRADANAEHIGIVDPFIVGHVWPGDRFWLVLFPGTTRNLRHNWSHPALPDDDAVAEPPRLIGTMHDREEAEYDDGSGRCSC